MIFKIAYILLLIGLGIIIWQLSILSGKRIVSGTIIDLPFSGGKHSGYGIKARFNVGQMEYNYISNWTSSSPNGKIGDSILIYYNESNPINNGLCTFGARFGISFIIIFIGLCLISFPIIWKISSYIFDWVYKIS